MSSAPQTLGPKCPARDGNAWYAVISSLVKKIKGVTVTNAVLYTATSARFAKAKVRGQFILANLPGAHTRGLESTCHIAGVLRLGKRPT